MKTVPEPLLAHIQGAELVVLTTHIRPDGDALGSLFGMADILRSMGREVHCCLDDEPPAMYRFLPGSEQVCRAEQVVEQYLAHDEAARLVLALDCGDLQRLGGSGPLLRGMHPFAVIDHHGSNNGFGDLNWVEPHRSSTGEMIVDLAEALGNPLSPAGATCLYVAIATDTGSFRFPATSSHTHRVTAALIDAGADPGRISEQLYDSWSLGRLRLLQEVLATLELFEDGRIAVIRADRAMFERTGTGMEDTEDFINLPRSLETVRIAVFLREQEDAVSVSLRSSVDCDVSEVAARFGGGGHAQAGGFRKSGIGMDRLWKQLLPRLIRQLEKV